MEPIKGKNEEPPKSYQPPWCIRIIFNILIEVIKRGTEKEIKISVVVENFRTAFYWSFLGIIVFGAFLTKVFTKVDSTAIINDVFGASNICTYFDFPPSTYVLPFCWIFAMLFAIAYDMISMFRIWIAKEEHPDKISCLMKRT